MKPAEEQVDTFDDFVHARLADLVHATDGWFLVGPGGTARTDLPTGTDFFSMTMSTDGTA